MKKLVATIWIVMCLLTLAGCGKGTKDSVDPDSLYAYSWQENQDGSLQVKIKGKWDKDCSWKAEYDPTVLDVTAARKDGRFTVSSVNPGVSKVDFKLYRQEQEVSEYGIWLKVTANSSGVLRVVDYSHQDPFVEGSYTSTNDGNTLLVTLNTTHQWDYRILQKDFRVETEQASDTAVVYRITAKHSGAGELDLWDTESEQKLVLSLTAMDGCVYLTRAGEQENTSLADAALKEFWQEVGVKNTLPESVKVKDYEIVTDDEELNFPYGCLEVTIGEYDYDYLIANKKALTKWYTLEDVEEDGQVTAKVTSTEKDLGKGISAMVYQCESEVSVTWEQKGHYFVLYGEDMSIKEAAAAAKQIVGGGNG